jgi:hypothetical protein
MPTSTVHFRDLTCRKSATWDPRLYFPSEGRRTEDFTALKIRRLRTGLNPRTWVPEASTLTPRPSKSLHFGLKKNGCFPIAPTPTPYSFVCCLFYPYLCQTHFILLNFAIIKEFLSSAVLICSPHENTHLQIGYQTSPLRRLCLRMLREFGISKIRRHKDVTDTVIKTD